MASHCPTKKHKPNDDNVINIVGNHCNQPRKIDTSLVHLPSCQMIRYKPTPLPPPVRLDTCPPPKMSSPNACVDAPKNPNCDY